MSPESRIVGSSSQGENSSKAVKDDHDNYSDPEQQSLSKSKAGGHLNRNNSGTELNPKQEALDRLHLAQVSFIILGLKV